MAPRAATGAKARLLDALPATLEQLAAETALPPDKLREMLAVLIYEGKVRNRGGLYQKGANNG